MTKARDDLPPEYIKTALDYDPETGFLRWKIRADKNVQWNGKFAGKIAGTINDRGYAIIAINGPDFRAHRLAWVIMTGSWPKGEIDHINLIKSDNRWVNLREATHEQNNFNKTAQSNNTSGFKGVSFCKIRKMWCAQIRANGVLHRLGYSHDPREAALLYEQAATTIHGNYSNCEGNKNAAD